LEAKAVTLLKFRRTFGPNFSKSPQKFWSFLKKISKVKTARIPDTMSDIPVCDAIFSACNLNRVRGDNLDRISSLGEIIGSANKNQIYKMQKNWEKIGNIPMSYIYNFKKVSTQNSIYI
jgi:hypothetical protein